MKTVSALIIDDNEEDRYLLSRQLLETELIDTIIEKGDGKQALDFFLNHQESRKLHPDAFPPVLVFLDINMPFLNGYEFLEQFAGLRQLINAQSSIFLMFTSSERESEKNKALDYSFVKDFLVKGRFTSEQLKEKIQQLIM